MNINFGRATAGMLKYAAAFGVTLLFAAPAVGADNSEPNGDFGLQIGGTVHASQVSCNGDNQHFGQGCEVGNAFARMVQPPRSVDRPADAGISLTKYSRERHMAVTIYSQHDMCSTKNPNLASFFTCRREKENNEWKKSTFPRSFRRP
jgi:hypothetical protein